MTQTAVKRFLLLYFVVFYGAMLLRIDYFPFSWVPMYGFHRADDGRTVVIGDRDARKRGFGAQRANGERLYISAADLGVPNANFRRLYAQRAFNVAPPQDERERLALSPINRWWYETFIGPDPMSRANYAGPLLVSVNKTFGYGPQDPQRIVRLDVTVKTATFTPEKLTRGELHRPILGQRTSVITEQGTTITTDDKVLIIGPQGVSKVDGDLDD